MKDQTPRLDLVAHIKEHIAAGTYETRGKLEAVAGRIARDLTPPPA